MLGYVDLSNDPHNPFGNAIAEAHRQIDETSLKVNRYAALLQIDGQLDKSLNVLDSYLKKFPFDEQAKYLKSLILLSKGEYAEGFKLYEHRFSMYPSKQAIQRSRPQWRGEETDKRVIIWQEGGFGDVINFGARYFPEVLRRCPNALLLVDPSIIGLLVASGIPASAMPVTREDIDKDFSDTLACSIQSLMHILKIDRHLITGLPYIKVPEQALERWRPVMANKPWIGFCWRGNPVHERDNTRSMPDEVAYRFGESVDVFSLMKEHLTGVTDWSDTAAIVSCLDLVITVDTAIAHVAAAMGKPTWILLPVDFDWRWMAKGNFTHWYGSARLFRFKKHGDWISVLDDVTAALKVSAG